ncbi:MAG: hypothetical protein EOO61_07455 [Hymenobacter sp.]|nr:MAG: hypothetical protein EOO61_07455 [Hymenobacter sp.]
MKATFEEKFAVLAFCCLFAYICVCTFLNLKTESIRDSWNLILFIAGTVWKSTRKTSTPAEPAPGNTTATINAEFTTSAEKETESAPESGLPQFGRTIPSPPAKF